MPHARRIFLVLPLAIWGAAAQPLVAQSSIAEELRREWASSRRQMVAIAEAMPAEKFHFKPTPEVRSFGEIVAHFAGENLAWMETVAGVPDSGRGARITNLQDRGEILRAVSEYFDYGATVLANLTDQTALETVPLMGRRLPRWLVVMEAIGHSKEHYGNLVTYLRLSGITPPASA